MTNHLLKQGLLLFFSFTVLPFLITQDVQLTVESGCTTTFNKIEKETEETIVLTQPKKLKIASTTSVKTLINLINS